MSSLNQEDTDENFVIRRYLETLWLPEVSLYGLPIGYAHALVLVL